VLFVIYSYAYFRMFCLRCLYFSRFLLFLNWPTGRGFSTQIIFIWIELNLNWIIIFIPLLSYCAVFVYWCTVYSNVYLAGGLFSHTQSLTERFYLNIWKNVHFAIFLTVIYVYILSCFLLPLLRVFVCCLYLCIFLIFLCYLCNWPCGCCGSTWIRNNWIIIIIIIIITNTVVIVYP
jgi:hypothetical protein